MSKATEDFIETAEGKPFDPEWISEFNFIVQVPDIPLFEKIAYSQPSIEFEYKNEHHRRIYNICGWSDEIAQLFIQFGKQST